MTKPAVIAFASLLMLTRVATAFAGNAVVMPFEAVNVAPEDARAISVLFARAYEGASGHKVMPGGPEASPGEACQAAACQLIVTGVATRLGARIVIAASESTPTGAVVHSAEATATSMDDMEGVLPRLAQALARHTAYGQTRGPETVTQRETFTPDKVKSVSVPGLRAGMLVFNAGGEVGTSVEGAVDVRFERGRTFVNFGVGLILPASAEGKPSYGGLTAELGGGLYLSDGDFAPYVGAGISPKIGGISTTTMSTVGNSSNTGGGAGLGLQGRAGVMFMRTGTTRLLLETGIEQELIEMAGTRPTIFRLSGGVAF